MAKVLVGLSGGVDSSVSAAVLAAEENQVIGGFIKVWQPDFARCSWREDRLDAMRIAAALHIPFETFDFEAEYKQAVIDYMLNEYKTGRTPNPDVMCNRSIKFGAFWEQAQIRDCSHVATGHYVQNIHNAKTGLWELHQGADQNKDQSYFLWTLTQTDLEHILFPIGHLTKTQVRALAQEKKFVTATKKDSQGLCFMGQVDVRDFLKKYITTTPGDVLDTSQNIIGKHDGAILYTLGQRHGFHVAAKQANTKALYVIAKDIDANTITVSNTPQEESIARRKVHLTNINWVAGVPPIDGNYSVRYRHRQQLLTTILQSSEHETTITFNEPRHDVANGQSLVIYNNTECLGGGVIGRTV